MVSKENNLKQYMEITPVLLFCINLIVYANYIMSEYYGVTYIMEIFYWSFKHTFDASLITLLFMYYISLRDKWRSLSKICLYALSLIWLNNIPYVVLGYDPEHYFFIFASIIYITTIILSLRFLTRR